MINKKCNIPMAICLLFYLIQTIFLAFFLLNTPQNSPAAVNNRLSGQKLGQEFDESVNNSLNWIYIITPTYQRNTQLADLTRLSYTLLHVEKICWILVEDSFTKTEDILDFMKNLEDLIKIKGSDMKLVHLNIPTPPDAKLKQKERRWRKPRGVFQRNEGLDWVHKNINELDEDGVLYFADDDNTYDLRLFNEMRDTRKVSCWPVALVGGRLVEKPIAVNGKVIGFEAWKPKRTFAMDMAAFALNINLLRQNSGAKFYLTSKLGFLEEDFLSQIINSRDDLEPKANQCASIFVWHTRTENFVPTAH